MRLDDFVMLGRTEPTQSKRHGICICSAGYSRELRQFIRIYPLSLANTLRVWTKCVIPMERPKQDSRLESWRIAAPEHYVGKPEHAIQIVGRVEKDQEFDFLQRMSSPSIFHLNEQKLSLGIIKPHTLRGEFRLRENVDPADQLTLFERLQPDGPLEKSDLLPILTFEDASGYHQLSLKEWGCARFLVKNRMKADELWAALNLTDGDYEHLLFIGNQANARSAWLVIKVISRRKSKQTDLFNFYQ